MGNLYNFIIKFKFSWFLLFRFIFIYSKLLINGNWILSINIKNIIIIKIKIIIIIIIFNEKLKTSFDANDVT